MDKGKILTLISLGLGLISVFYDYVADSIFFGIGGLVCGIFAYNIFNNSKISNTPAIVVMVLNAIAILYNFSFL
jgi:hypothetical protein